jgi:hypothetical protein
MYKNTKYIFGRHIDITNIENAVDARNSRSTNDDLLGDIKHITPIKYGGLLLVNNDKNY